MIRMLLLFAQLLATSPKRSSELGARLAGHPEYASEIAAFCKSESQCTAIGIHGGLLPRVKGVVFWRAAQAVGWLGACDELGDGDRWGIRGAHGLAAAYSVQVFGECVPPEIIDVPLLSAIATAHRLHALRRTYRKRTPAARAHAWRHGVGCHCEP